MGGGKRLKGWMNSRASASLAVADGVLAGALRAAQSHERAVHDFTTTMALLGKSYDATQALIDEARVNATKSPRSFVCVLGEIERRELRMDLMAHSEAKEKTNGE